MRYWGAPARLPPTPARHDEPPNKGIWTPSLADAWRPNSGMRLAKPGERRSFAACPRCSTDKRRRWTAWLRPNRRCGGHVEGCGVLRGKPWANRDATRAARTATAVRIRAGSTEHLSPAVHALGFCVFLVMWQAFRRAAAGKVPRVTAGAVARRREEYEQALSRLEGADERFLERAAVVQTSRDRPSSATWSRRSWRLRTIRLTLSS